MNITTGIQPQPHFALIYGVEGVGKTLFGAGAPQPLFLDTENSSAHLGTVREKIESLDQWEKSLEELKNSSELKARFKTIVTDSLDQGTKLVEQWVLANYTTEGGARVKSIEGFGYGKGYTYVREVWQRLIDRYRDLRTAGYNVIVVAHSDAVTVADPTTQQNYKMYDLKLTRTASNNVSALWKEAVDSVLFYNYDRQTKKTDKVRSYGDDRVLYTQYSPGFAAKNRFGLPPQLVVPNLEIDPNTTPEQIIAEAAKVWGTYADAVQRRTTEGPDYGALVSLAEQIQEAPTRTKALEALAKDKHDAVKMAKHAERLRALVSKGKDTQPQAMPATTGEML